TREAIASIAGAQATRGEFLDAQQGGFYNQVAEHPQIAGKLWETTLAEREATYMAEARDHEREEEDLGGGYHEVAVDLMAGLLAGERGRMILDVPNNGAIPALPDDAVIEIPCEVDERGVHLIRPAAALDLDQLGIVAAVIAAVRALNADGRAIIAPVRACSRSGAWHAFGVHPAVDSTTVAQDLVNDYIAAQPLIAAALPHP